MIAASEQELSRWAWPYSVNLSQPAPLPTPALALGGAFESLHPRTLTKRSPCVLSIGYLPNSAHAVEAMLAAASIGAIWSSTSPDFGVNVSRGPLKCPGCATPAGNHSL